MATPGREALVGKVLLGFVEWARVLGAQRRFPFEGRQLSAPQVQVLFTLTHAEQAASPSRLAELLGVTRGAVTQLVAGLVDLGLVTQERDATDGRRRRLVLSGEARASVEAFEQDMVTRVAPRFDELDDDELAQLANLLQRTRRAP